MNPKAKQLYDLYTETPPTRGNSFKTLYWRGRDFPDRKNLAPAKNTACYGAWLAGVHSSKPV